MAESLTAPDLSPLLSRLTQTNRQFDVDYPGVRIDRQPVQTLYGGANLYKAGASDKMASLALRHMATYAPTFVDMARALDLPGAESLPAEALAIDTLGQELDAFTDDTVGRSSAWIARRVFQRVRHKLEHEAVEDHRIDFEDGYGVRADAEEDGHAIATAGAVAQGLAEGSLPPFIGIRIKALTEEAKLRSLRTLDLFITTLAQHCQSNQGSGPIKLPQPFKITLPKVTTPDQVAVLADCLTLLEQKNNIAEDTLHIELMIETVQSVLTPAGECGIPALVLAGKGRVTAAILGTFDYTATCNIASTYQDHRHPAADFARHMMQLSLTGTDVTLSDGITNIMPIAPHRGESLSSAQLQENSEVVHAAWRVHFDNIMHSLKLGFYQSWDLNPAQLPIRYAAVYYFFLEGLAEATARLTTFIDQAAQASMVGNTFDDAASAQGLLNFFISGINCGALTDDEALATGITLDELHGRSFLEIVENRTKQ